MPTSPALLSAAWPRRRVPTPVILSYYSLWDWRSEDDEALSAHPLTAVNALASDGTHAPATFTPWRNDGRMALWLERGRDYPVGIDTAGLIARWCPGIEASDGLCFDELIEGQTPQAYLDAIQSIRKRFPFGTKQLTFFVSGAAYTDRELMETLHAAADYILPEIYVKQSEASAFDARLTQILQNYSGQQADGVRKLVPTIAVVPNHRGDQWADVDPNLFGDHLVYQVRAYAANALAQQSAGLGLYTPWYTRRDHLVMLNDALTTYVLR